jgi:aconitate hydratase
MSADPFNSIRPLEVDGTSVGSIHSLPALEETGLGNISRLPVSIRIVLESLLRNCDGSRVDETDVRRLAAWDSKSPSPLEIPFVVSRIVLQDFTGVPLLVDLAAMRDAVSAQGADPALIEPLVPVDLVVDHSVQVDSAGTSSAYEDNLQLEFQRNRERYEFLKWGQGAFDTFTVVPPAIGIVHQVNLEYLARVVFSKKIDGQKILYPDTLVGTDSHTTMINGLGIVGWGVGGIEAEAGMLGQPVYFRTPEVIGVNLTGCLHEGVTATDLALRITEMLRKEQVVGKFVEFFGEGTAALPLADRATIANMAPEYGATMGFFPVDDKTLDYLRITGRDEAHIALIKGYFQAQGLYGIPAKGQIDYTRSIDLDLGSIEPSVAGPRRPQDRISVNKLKGNFQDMLGQPISSGGFGLSEADCTTAINVSRNGDSTTLGHGSVLIAAITSCTNTSNPSVMVAAGLLARKAVEKGLSVNSSVKTSLAPGSRVVTDYLKAAGLQDSLNQLGFNLVGYGCTTCIGNSGPLAADIENAIKEGNLVAASVLSGNRNFEARVHGSIKANFLMSPPLVVAYAIAGKVDIDFDSEPLGHGPDGHPVYLKDVWPTLEEVNAVVSSSLSPEMFTSKYSNLYDANPQWTGIQTSTGALYGWDSESTYIQHPPFFDGFSPEVGEILPVIGMRPLALLGDSVTTDHISPAGAILEEGPAGRFLKSNGVEKVNFNSFGSRRGNDRIMTRGTFANVRIRNNMAEGREGGYTKLQPEGEILSIYDACQKYSERNTPLIVFAGIDYGMGSSRDWAAKGTNLLGVRAVVAKSFERIHRSNLIGMGVLPLEFTNGDSAETLGLDGTEIFSLPGLGNDLQPGQSLDLEIQQSDGATVTVQAKVRIDTQIEVEYFRNGGILPYVLRQILQNVG